MTCTFARNQTAAEILPTVPKGKELRSKAQLEQTMKLTMGNLESFVLLNQPKKEQQHPFINQELKL